MPVKFSHLDIDMGAALSMGADTLDDRREPLGNEGKELGNALAEMEEAQPEGRGVVRFEAVDEPRGRAAWGMQWEKRDNKWELRPIQSCILELARDAEELFY